MIRVFGLTIIGGLLIFSGFRLFSTTEPEIDFRPEYLNKNQRVIRKLPADLAFAGEPVLFKTPDAYQKFYRELSVNTQKNSSTRLLLKNVRIWLPEIARVIKAHNLPEDLKYVAIAESNLTNQISHKGAVGFWQFIEGTAIAYGLEVNNEVDERYHAIKSTEAACRYFSSAHDLFGNWTSAAASYNRGMYGLLAAYQKQKVNTYYELTLNDETSRYLYRIVVIKDLVKNPGKYGMKTFTANLPPIKKIRVDSSITDLTRFARKHGIELNVLKEFNPWLLKNTLTIKGKGKYYILQVPVLPKQVAIKEESQVITSK